MEQHPIPRQITTFEFKLIGFMTLRQFLYLVVFCPLGFIVFKLFPIPLINFLLAILTALFGVALAFIPINDRPLDVWIKNFIRRLSSPTQYVFHKANAPVSFLQNLVYISDPHHTLGHIEAREKLSAYLVKTKATAQNNQKKQAVQHLIRQPLQSKSGQSATNNQSAMGSQPLTANNQQSATNNIQEIGNSGQSTVNNNISQASVNQPATTNSSGEKAPHLIGVVKNSKQLPLPGILIYIKDVNNNIVRLLKTNPHGVFATFSALTPGEYSFEIKDTNSLYFFDTIKIKVDNTPIKSIEIYSKEIL